MKEIEIFESWGLLIIEFRRAEFLTNSSDERGVVAKKNVMKGREKQSNNSDTKDPKQKKISKTSIFVYSRPNIKIIHSNKTPNAPTNSRVDDLLKKKGHNLSHQNRHHHNQKHHYDLTHQKKNHHHNRNGMSG
jgi:hypothetical protein